MNVPHGIKVRNANDIIPNQQIFRDAATDGRLGSFANFSDIFRWRLLSHEPGWWFDLDMVAIAAPSEAELSRGLYVASTWEGDYQQCAITCAMYSSGKSKLFDEALIRAQQILQEKAEREFCDLGPFLLQSLIREFGCETSVAPWWEFCPFPWRQIKASCYATRDEHILNRARIIKHSIQSWTGHTVRPAMIRDGTRAVHLHNEIWRLSEISKSGPFYRHSFVGSQMLKYRIPNVYIS